MKLLPKTNYGSCPFCQSNRLVKAGFYRKEGKPNTQRYQCPTCHRFTTKPVTQLSLIPK